MFAIRTPAKGFGARELEAAGRVILSMVDS